MPVIAISCGFDPHRMYEVKHLTLSPLTQNSVEKGVPMDDGENIDHGFYSPRSTAYADRVTPVNLF